METMLCEREAGRTKNMQRLSCLETETKEKLLRGEPYEEARGPMRGVCERKLAG